MSADVVDPNQAAGASSLPAIEIRNRTKGPYSDSDLAGIVRVASGGLVFPRRVRVTFIPKRWRLFHGRSSGWTWCFTMPGGRVRSAVVQVHLSQNVRRSSSIESMSPARREKSSKKGYLPKPEMRGVELPIFDTAHELYHATHDRCTLSRSRRRSYETAADTHALWILEEHRRPGNAL
jgi:hypothetical protein